MTRYQQKNLNGKMFLYVTVLHGSVPSDKTITLHIINCSWALHPTTNPQQLHCIAEQYHQIETAVGPGLRSRNRSRSRSRRRSRSRSRSRPESLVLTGVGVGVGVGTFSSTPTPARSRNRLQHFFVIPFLVKMESKIETEHYLLTADSYDGLPYTVLLSLRLRLFPGELAFNHTSRLDNHNRQRHSLWGPVTCPCLINFGGVAS